MFSVNHQTVHGYLHIHSQGRLVQGGLADLEISGGIKCITALSEFLEAEPKIKTTYNDLTEHKKRQLITNLKDLQT